MDTTRRWVSGWLRCAMHTGILPTRFTTPCGLEFGLHTLIPIVPCDSTLQMSTSTGRTACAPSHGNRGGGGGDRKRPHGGGGGGGGPGGGPPPTDKLGAADIGPEGELRKILISFLVVANLGTVPSGGLFTAGGTEKTVPQRVSLVENWTNSFLNVTDEFMARRYSTMAVAFAHVVRAASAAGLFDQVVMILVEEFTAREQRRRNDDDDSPW